MPGWACAAKNRSTALRIADEIAGEAGRHGLGHVINEPFCFDLDMVFEYGLQRLLDGIAAPAPCHRLSGITGIV